MSTLESPDRKRLLVAFSEEKDVIDLIDEIASQEGSNRSAIIRRMIRLGLSATDLTKILNPLMALHSNYQQ